MFSRYIIPTPIFVSMLRRIRGRKRNDRPSRERRRTPPPVKPERTLNAQFGSRKNNIYLWWFARRGKNRRTRKLCCSTKQSNPMETSTLSFFQPLTAAPLQSHIFRVVHGNSSNRRYQMLEILISYSESNTAMVEVGLIRNKNVCIGTNVTSSLW